MPTPEMAKAGGTPRPHGKGNDHPRASKPEILFWPKENRQGIGYANVNEPDGDWNNFPVRACFLPLIQQIASYLANQVTPPRNLPTGSTITHYLPESKAGSSVEILCPNGSVVQSRAVRRGSQSVVEFPNTRQPGVYQISGSEFGPIKFVANASPSESMLGRIDRRKFENACKPNETVDFIETSEANPLTKYLEIDSARTFGRETWKLLLGVVLGLVLLELILQRIFGRGRG